MMGGGTGHGARSARNAAASQMFGSQNMVQAAQPITQAINDMILGVLKGDAQGKAQLPSTFVPIVANAVQDSKQATSRAAQQAKEVFTQQGLGGSSIMGSTLADIFFRGDQATGGIESQALQTLFNLAPVFGLNAQQVGLGLTGQSSAGFSAAGALEMQGQAQRAQLISSLGSTVGQGLGQIIGSGISSGAFTGGGDSAGASELGAGESL